MNAWNSGTSGRTGATSVTILEGSSFCLSAGSGDLWANVPHGVFFADTRILSQWNLVVDGHDVDTLSAHTPEPYRAVHVARLTSPGSVVEPTLVLRRDRHVGAGLRELVTIHNYGHEPVSLVLSLLVDADFADLFDVKVGLAGPPAEVRREVRPDGLLLSAQRAGVTRGILVHGLAAEVHPEGLRFRAEVPARQQWSASVIATPLLDGRGPAEQFLHSLPPGSTGGMRRREAWAGHLPRLEVSNEDVERVLERSHADLGSLRIFDTEHPGRTVLAAGAPWFMALFGRDSLLTSLMTLPLDPSLALGTLQTLAELQGDRVVPVTEEEPGRFLHEVRLGASATLALGDRAYYGTVDATPLFVVLLGELSRWLPDDRHLAGLLPHADRALAWLDTYGDRDGDGFVEYCRATDTGLANQGWKDSWDGVTFADGRVAEAPIALCEVQGYTYAAFRARARLARLAGDTGVARHWADRASRLRRAFNERFWLPDRGYYALALDGDKRPVDSCASNMGHCLWSGIVDGDHAPLVVDRLMSPEMFTGWGVRTLASDMGAYNPVSYHNGSVWPHDNALIVAGLVRYGFIGEARRLASALFEAATLFDDRLPELFCGFSRTEYPEPVPYPTSCSPQAWAAAAPVHIMRTLLRLEPALPERELWLSPVVPEEFGSFRAENLLIGTSRVTLDVTDGEVSVEGLPDDVQLRRLPYNPDADDARTKE